MVGKNRAEQLNMQITLECWGEISITLNNPHATTVYTKLKITHWASLCCSLLAFEVCKYCKALLIMIIGYVLQELEDIILIALHTPLLLLCWELRKQQCRGRAKSFNCAIKFHFAASCLYRKRFYCCKLAFKLNFSRFLCSKHRFKLSRCPLSRCCYILMYKSRHVSRDRKITACLT